MARPLRIEFPGAIDHVTSRGDRREPIFVDDVDRRALLDVLGSGLERFDASALAWCLMGNHVEPNPVHAGLMAEAAQRFSQLSMSHIARALGLSVSRVSRIVARSQANLE